MNDREMLELAAKAAGVRLEWDGNPDAWQPMYYEGKTYHSWDPLTDDGEALRLAVRLRVDVTFVGNVVEVCWFSQPTGTTGYTEEPVNDAQSECEATRRAIVRAAAEIGATQPSKDGGGEHG